MLEPSLVRKYSHLVAIAILLAGLFVYLYRIDEWYIDDDEGEFAYAAWRISEGEAPYRGFLTEQLPLFLFWGGALVRIFGPSLIVLRYATVAATLLAAFFAYLTARQVLGHRVALLSLPLFLVHKDVYFIARLFRPEAYLLFFAAMGMYVLVRAFPERRWRGALVSGALFGLAMLCKLFAALPFGGCALFLLYDWLRTRDERVWEQMLALVAGFVSVAGTIFVAFQVVAPYFLTAVFGHHVMQGAELSQVQVLAKALRFYWDYARGNLPFLILAFVGALRSVRNRAGLGSFFLWQVPTAAAFLVLSRDLQDRHLVYAVPALAALAAYALDALLRAQPAMGGSVIERAASWLEGLPRIALIPPLLLLALLPSVLKDLDVASWEERHTLALAGYIQEHTESDDYVLSDYAGDNFHAQRRTTYWGAGLSGGATSSGQITSRRLIEDMQANDVQMVLINTYGGAHQLVGMEDYAGFRRYVQNHFHLVRLFHRSYQTFEIYHRADLMPPLDQASFGSRLGLTGADVGQESVEAGTELSLALRWQAQEAMERDYTVSLRLVDEAGHIYGQRDHLLTKTYTAGWSGPTEIIRQAPTSEWASGESVLGEHTLPVLGGTPPGTYSLVALLYQLESGQVLAVVDQDGQPLRSEHVVAAVQVLRPQVPPKTEELEMQRTVMAAVGAELTLLGHGPLGEQVRPGDVLTLALFWQAQRSMARDWQLQLRVLGAEREAWAEGTFDLANAQHPTTQWMAGEVVLGQYDLQLDAAAAGPAQIVLNLVERGIDRRLLAADLALAELRVEGRERTFDVPEAMQHAVNANLGGRVTLLGYDLGRTSLRRGNVLELMLYWQSQVRMDTSYTVFTHLLGPDGQLWGQQDNLPVQGSYPTTGWLPGEVIEDLYAIEVAPDAPPGEYALEVGMYDASSAERLPLLDADGQAVDNRVLIPGLTVEE